MCQIAAASSTLDHGTTRTTDGSRLVLDAYTYDTSSLTVPVHSPHDLSHTLHQCRRRVSSASDDDDITAVSAFRPYSCATTSSSCSSYDRLPFDSVEPQPLDLRVRVSTGPSTPAFASTEPRSTVFSSSYDHKTRTLTATTNIVETEYLEPNQILRTSTTKTHTTSPKTQKGNYFLIDSLLTPARSSDIQLDSTCKVVERTPVSFGCSVGASFRSPCSTIDISKRSRIVPERDVARTPATSVLSAHRTNGQQENAATPMKKLKREPDDNSATMTPPPNICVDDEVKDCRTWKDSSDQWRGRSGNAGLRLPHPRQFYISCLELCMKRLK
ncbi:hypothetical protein Q1695_000562 [Nippostrongylus brasiliensis]|nr:hypothetical protein Q1695_000562 [Nippostrongylus brasiliensis]